MATGNDVPQRLAPATDDDVSGFDSDPHDVTTGGGRRIVVERTDAGADTTTECGGEVRIVAVVQSNEERYLLVFPQSSDVIHDGRGRGPGSGGERCDRGDADVRSGPCMGDGPSTERVACRGTLWTIRA